MIADRRPPLDRQYNCNLFRLLNTTLNMTNEPARLAFIAEV